MATSSWNLLGLVSCSQTLYPTATLIHRVIPFPWISRELYFCVYCVRGVIPYLMTTESSSAPCPAPNTRCCRCNGTAKCLRCVCVRSGTPYSRCLPGVSGRCHNTLPCDTLPHPTLPATTTQFVGNPLAGVSSLALTYALSPLAVSSTPSTVSPPTSLRLHLVPLHCHPSPLSSSPMCPLCGMYQKVPVTAGPSPSAHISGLF